MMEAKTKRILATFFGPGKTHDFKLYQNSKIRLHPTIRIITDSGYQGLQKLHVNTELPKKRTKLHPLTKEDKQNNRKTAQNRVSNEHVIGDLKKFKVIAERYRNRRKRFSKRFNIIAGIYNFELTV